MMVNKLGLSCAKLKLSLVRVADEVTLIVNSVEVEIEVRVELPLLVLVGGGWVSGLEKKKQAGAELGQAQVLFSLELTMKSQLFSTQFKLKLKL